MKKIPITKAGFLKIKRELDHLKSVVVPENIRDIEAARAHGDLSENAEYTAAKERQTFLQNRIQELESQLAASDIIEIRNITTDHVVFGASVVITDLDTGEVITYKLVGPLESDIANNMISVTSPIGKALIGHKVGDEIQVHTPGGVREFQIVEIFVDNGD
ncbi:MAG: transcription elongation factor GreA [Syntrophales bacterium]|nr:transcription elongation factor GreA [Syntrophales bacterium]